MDKEVLFSHNNAVYRKLYQVDPACYECGIPPGEAGYWHHGDDNCGGEIWLGDNCHLLCKKCMQEIPLKKALWASPETYGVSENQIYFSGNIGYRIATPLSVTGSTIYEAASPGWLCKLLIAAIEMYDIK